MTLKKNEHHLLTRGIFYCRVSAEINGCGSLQLSCNLIGNRTQSATKTYRQPLIENDNLFFGIGSGLSYYYFFYDRKTNLTHYRPFPDNFIQQAESESVYNKKNRIGLNFYVEFEIKSVVIEKLNLFSRLNTGLITYGTFAHQMGGFDSTWPTEWLTINFGLRYGLQK